MNNARSSLVMVVLAMLAASSLAAQPIDTNQLSDRFSADMRQQLKNFTQESELQYGPWVVHQLGTALFSRTLTVGKRQWIALFYGTLTLDTPNRTWSVDDLSILSVRTLPSADPVSFQVLPNCAPREWTCVRTISCGKRTSFLDADVWHDGRYDAAIDRIVVPDQTINRPNVFFAADGSSWTANRIAGDSLWYVGHTIRYRSGVKGAMDKLVVGSRSTDVDPAATVVALAMIPEDVTDQRPSGDVLVRSGATVRLVTPTNEVALAMPANVTEMLAEPVRLQGKHRCYHFVPRGATKQRMAWCVSASNMSAAKGRCQHE